MIKPLLFVTTALILGSIGSAAHAGDFCREFTSMVTIGNRLQESIGTACLNPDGSWQIVSGNNVGSTFYDNGPTAYGSNNVTYVQPNMVYYQQPPQVNYVLRERVYQPRLSTIIISNGYGNRYYPRHYANYNPRPWGGGWDRGRGGGHDHDRGRGHDDHRR
jgi:hypothetical protein